MRISITRRTSVLLLSLAIAAIAGTVVAMAAIPSADGTIEGCYDPSAGKPPYPLSVVDKPSDCQAPSGLLPFAQTGPAGPAGAVGATGPTGAPGTAAPVGTGGDVYTGGFDAEVSGGPQLLTPARPTATVHLDLPAGTYAVVGEVSVGLNSGGFAQVACWLTNDQSSAPAGLDAHYFPLGAYRPTDVNRVVEGNADLHATFTAPAAVRVTLSCGIHGAESGVVVDQSVGRLIATTQTRVVDEPGGLALSHTAPPSGVVSHLHIPTVARKPATKAHR